MPRDTSRPKSQWSVPEDRLGKVEIGTEREEGYAGAHCLTVDEAERIVENLEEFELQDVGSQRWLEQHGQVEKLNQQAHASARDKSDEYVKDLPNLINDVRKDLGVPKLPFVVGVSGMGGFRPLLGHAVHRCLGCADGHDHSCSILRCQRQPSP